MKILQVRVCQSIVHRYALVRVEGEQLGQQIQSLRVRACREEGGEVGWHTLLVLKNAVYGGGVGDKVQLRVTRATQLGHNDLKLVLGVVPV